MLELATFHGIHATIVRYKLSQSGIGKAMIDLREGKIKDRYKAMPLTLG